jgi:hypothetical protein
MELNSAQVNELNMLIEKDSKFLMKYGIMDYSLLLVIE